MQLCETQEPSTKLSCGAADGGGVPPLVVVPGANCLRCKVTTTCPSSGLAGCRRAVIARFALQNSRWISSVERTGLRACGGSSNDVEFSRCLAAGLVWLRETDRTEMDSLLSSRSEEHTSELQSL